MGVSQKLETNSFTKIFNMFFRKSRHAIKVRTLANSAMLITMKQFEFFVRRSRSHKFVVSRFLERGFHGFFQKISVFWIFKINSTEPIFFPNVFQYCAAYHCIQCRVHILFLQSYRCVCHFGGITGSTKT